MGNFHSISHYMMMLQLSKKNIHLMKYKKNKKKGNLGIAYYFHKYHQDMSSNTPLRYHRKPLSLDSFDSICHLFYQCKILKYMKSNQKLCRCMKYSFVNKLRKLNQLVHIQHHKNSHKCYLVKVHILQYKKHKFQDFNILNTRISMEGKLNLFNFYNRHQDKERYIFLQIDKYYQNMMYKNSQENMFYSYYYTKYKLH